MTWKQLTAEITDDYEKALHWLELSIFTAHYVDRTMQ